MKPETMPEPTVSDFHTNAPLTRSMVGPATADEVWSMLAYMDRERERIARLEDRPSPTAILDNGAIYRAAGETDADLIKRAKKRFGIGLPSELNLGTANGITFRFKRILRVPFTRITLWLMRLS